ncbi:hypothetical protein BMS3Abin04_02225 [bacterium BMS3Abin04]|nr:hypothetical protein BMS3Abin04_02225 [bacterium BMS3Abin04]
MLVLFLRLRRLLSLPRICWNIIRMWLKKILILIRNFILEVKLYFLKKVKKSLKLVLIVSKNLKILLKLIILNLNKVIRKILKQYLFFHLHVQVQLYLELCWPAMKSYFHLRNLIYFLLIHSNKETIFSEIKVLIFGLSQL